MPWPEGRAAGLLRSLLSWLYPPLCVGCNSLLHTSRAGFQVDHWLCSACIGPLPVLVPPYCARCGEAYDGAREPDFHCGNCADRPFAFEFALAGYHAEGQVRELVHQFKYGREYHLRRVLAVLAARAFEDPRLQALLPLKPVLVPVPLHPTRLRWRGYNQSEAIAQQLGKLLTLPTKNALRRTQPTEAQAGLTRAQRLSNLKQAFALRPAFAGSSSELRGRCVILVDDVFTTGSTAHECARALRRGSGVEKVVVVTVARG
jgi:competence protein ComFC